MFGDAEHYKYLTNEADLNNLGDDSLALTPKTPKRVSLFVNVCVCVCVCALLKVFENRSMKAKYLFYYVFE